VTAVVADTVTIIWWLADDERLSQAAAVALQNADAGDGIFVSAVTLVDIWYATHKAKRCPVGRAVG
jgi:PIN domain nuclease of toxin-antitoxin system